VIVEHDGRIPREWTEGYARLDPDRSPDDVPLRCWQQFIDDTRRFLNSGFAERAAALGWGSHDLFGCDRDRPFALPVAHATDGGGSIRIPAAQCGLFGLKPSRGRVSMAPDAGEGWGGLSTGHVVSRSVRDSALMLDCTAGPEPGDPYAAPVSEGSFLEAIARPPRKLRIALMLKDHRGAKLHPECLAAVENAAKLCATLGHTVEEADPELDMAALRPLNARISAANIACSAHSAFRTPEASENLIGAALGHCRRIATTGR
jgi:Amidase